MREGKKREKTRKTGRRSRTGGKELRGEEEIDLTGHEKEGEWKKGERGHKIENEGEERWKKNEGQRGEEEEKEMNLGREITSDGRKWARKRGKMRRKAKK